VKTFSLSYMAPGYTQLGPEKKNRDWSLSRPLLLSFVHASPKSYSHFVDNVDKNTFLFGLHLIIKGCKRCYQHLIEVFTSLLNTCKGTLKQTRLFFQ